MNARGKSTPSSTPGSFTASAGARSRVAPVAPQPMVVVGLPVLVTATEDGGWVLSPDMSDLADAIRETIEDGADDDGAAAVLLEQLAACDTPNVDAEDVEGESIIVALPVAVTRTDAGEWVADVDTGEMIDAIRETEAGNAARMIDAWRARIDR